ncbi:hypothetical protein R6Q59_016336 [Mikania micrantha]
MGPRPLLYYTTTKNLYPFFCPFYLHTRFELPVDGNIIRFAAVVTVAEVDFANGVDVSCDGVAGAIDVDPAFVVYIDDMTDLARQKPQRSFCRRCFSWTLATAFILLVLFSISAGVLYLILRPEKLKYTIDSVSINGINLMSSTPINPRLIVGIRAENPNDKLSVFYVGKGSSVIVNYAGVKLCDDRSSKPKLLRSTMS